MTAAAKNLTSRKARRASTGLASVDRVAAARVAAALASPAARNRQVVQMVDGEGHRINVSGPLADVIARAASLLADGRKVTVLADDEILTTQAAADRLNVSRQYVVRLVDDGVLPSSRVGTHRRLRASDVDAYKAKRDQQRDSALDRLASLSEEAGGYQLSE